MDDLRNLPELKQQLSDLITSSDMSDYALPDIFKRKFNGFGEYRIEEYYKYTIKVSSRTKICYIPNQWIFIAAICSQYCIELKKYKQKLVSLGVTDDDFEACHPSSSDKSMPEANRTPKYVSKKASDLLSSYDGDDKELLISFLWDYDSWGGGKNIKRDNDFTVSPCLNVANSINASSGLIGDIAKAIGDDIDLYNTIMDSDEMKRILKGKEINKIELVKTKAAASFLKEAMKATLEKDPNLRSLEKTGKYTTTDKSLFINDFWIGRDKNQPPTRNTDVYSDVTWSYAGKDYLLNVEITQAQLEDKLIPVYNDAYRNRLLMRKEASGYYVLYEITGSISHSGFIPEEPLQRIYYGTPGSGKSHKVKTIVERAYPDATEREKNVFRTTFHPDSDYASFVGCYKPQMQGDDIQYGFTPQAFTNAYIRAWEVPGTNIYLIIEEINRGNCAQIFGDLFQLLDRKDGVSEYSINADADLRKYIESKLGKEHEGITEGKLKLPKNLHILATMNTSDQSLFPMDSAFKRRWTWEYVPIDYNNIESSKFKIRIGGQEYSWNEFLKEVNKRIFDATDSEDKQMGNFFINADVDERQFIDKVMFYLWNDICKEEYHTSKNFLRRKTDDSADDNSEFSFNSLFEPGNSTKYLMEFMEYLGISPVVSSQSVPQSTADNV